MRIDPKHQEKDLEFSLRPFFEFLPKVMPNLSKFIKVSINALFEKFSRDENFRLKECTKNL
jgi:hypothetical protein